METAGKESISVFGSEDNKENSLKTGRVPMNPGIPQPLCYCSYCGKTKCKEMFCFRRNDRLRHSLQPGTHPTRLLMAINTKVIENTDKVVTGFQVTEKPEVSISKTESGSPKWVCSLVNEDDRFPTCLVEINGVPVKALVDTGSNCSLASASLAPLLGALESEDTNLDVVSASGDFIPILAKKVVELKIGDLVAEVELHVIKAGTASINFNVILGNDAMECFPAVIINCRSRTVSSDA